MSETAAPAEAAAAPEAPADDLRSVLSAAFETPTETQDAPTETAAEQRARDERGRFASKQADEPGTTAEAPAAPETPDQPETKAAEPAKPAIQPPQSWSAAAKARFNELPPEVQQEVLRRESDVERGFQQKGQALKEWEPVSQAIEPIKAKLAMAGVSPTQFVQNLVAAHTALETQPVQALQYLARQYGVDLRQFAQPAQPQQPTDPNVAALQQELQHVKGTLAQQQQAAQQAQMAEVQNSIETFAADPKHAHFETVRPMMGSLIQSGQAKDLAQAYEMAVWTHPQTRAAMLEQQRQADLAERQKQATAARGKAVSVTGSPAGGNSRIVPDSLRGALEAAFAGNIS